MNKLILGFSAAFVMAAGMASAQTVDCTLAANASDPGCVVVPTGTDVENFLPILAPLLAPLIVSAVVGGDGSSTPSTTN